MLVLAFETATPACTVALAENGALLAELTVVSPRAHSARLMPLIAQALAESGRSRHDLGGIAVGIGPGSFTGLRIGLATAKGLAYALDLPCAPVSTLAAMARNVAGGAAAAGAEPLICPLLDARRGDVFAALYAGSAERIAPRLVPLDNWLTALAEEGQPVLFAGDAAAGPLREAVAGAMGPLARFVPPGLAWPRAWAVADLGSAVLAAGGGIAADDLLPAYLRRSTPEERAGAGAPGG